MTRLKTTEIVHVTWVNRMLCELSQQSCFKIKVDPELKHLLNHRNFPQGEKRWSGRGEGREEGPDPNPQGGARKTGRGAGSPRTTTTVPVQRGEGSGRRLCGEEDRK